MLIGTWHLEMRLAAPKLLRPFRLRFVQYHRSDKVFEVRLLEVERSAMAGVILASRQLPVGIHTEVFYALATELGE